MSPLALSLRLLQAQPDDRLLALARGGHEPAFEALVRRYRRQLLAYCRNLAAPQASTEDILQQALMQAWTALASGVVVQDARAWLYRIVHNAAISATRKAGEDPTQLSQELSAVEVEQLVELRLAAREALAGLAALPELQREVMLGTAVEGRSHDEVAASLGITSGSVRGLLYRARSTLRGAAAALIPGPMIEWALRQETAGRTGLPGVVEAIAGGGTAGVAGAVLKGGAVVTVAGALAGTAAVVVTHRVQMQPTPAHAAVAHRAAPQRRIVALVGTPDIALASTRERGVSGTSASAAGSSLEPVRLSRADHHVRSPAVRTTHDTQQPLARVVTRSDRSRRDRAPGSRRHSGQTRTDGGGGSRTTEQQGTGSTTGTADNSRNGSDRTSSGGEATAARATHQDASATQGDASWTQGAGGATQGDASWTQGSGSATQGSGSGTQGSGSGTQGNGTSSSQAGSGAAPAGSQGTSSTNTQSAQPALPTPPSTGTSLTGSE